VRRRQSYKSKSCHQLVNVGRGYLKPRKPAKSQPRFQQQGTRLIVSNHISLKYSDQRPVIKRFPVENRSLILCLTADLTTARRCFRSKIGNRYCVYLLNLQQRVLVIDSKYMEKSSCIPRFKYVLNDIAKKNHRLSKVFFLAMIFRLTPNVPLIRNKFCLRFPSS